MTVTGRRVWVEHVMGMPVSIHVREPGRATAERVAAVYAELRRLDAIFSTYRPDSVIRRLAADGLDVPPPGPADATTPIRAVADLADRWPEVPEVLDLCAFAATLTGGAFDARRPDADGTRRLDPTGLVKGWAVERSARLLDPQEDWYVNAGGDVAVHVAAPDRPAWSIGVENPRDRRQVLTSVAMRTGGVATSGTAARGAHLWDPRTGRAAAPRLLSATVAGPSLTWADVYATAVYVDGPDAAAWVAELGYEVVVVDLAGTARRTVPPGGEHPGGWWW
ncbi:FAD:protein FMN transferase [Georgenia muralis]